MPQRPARVPCLAGSHSRRSPAAWAAVIVTAGAALARAGHAARAASQARGTPTCSWPLQVRGTASPAQAGLVGCYLRALAGRDTARLRYSADARAGLATAVFTPSPEDTTFTFVTITYADGVRENASMMNMTAMGGSPGWRMNIGAQVSPGSSGPLPAVASP